MLRPSANQLCHCSAVRPVQSQCPFTGPGAGMGNHRRIRAVAYQSLRVKGPHRGWSSGVVRERRCGAAAPIQLWSGVRSVHGSRADGAPRTVHRATRHGYAAGPGGHEADLPP